jgi:hypothetical protein
LSICVAEQTRRRIATAGLTDRGDVIGGDAFQDLPAGADGYILSTVIHDWDVEHAIALLRSCRRAMTPNSRLALIERILPARLDNPLLSRPVVMSDLNMVMTGGHERTVTEYEALLHAAGFALTRVNANRLDHVGHRSETVVLAATSVILSYGVQRIPP